MDHRRAAVAIGITALMIGVAAPVSRVAAQGSTTVDVQAFGNAAYRGSTNPSSSNAPIVGIARTTTTHGYWEAAADGGVFSFGDARFYGSLVGKPLNQPIVGIASTRTGQGYWLVAGDGGVFTFGDARFYGSMGGTRLSRPIVGIAPKPTGKGYWLAASDGGVFSFGDARFRGSLGAERYRGTVVAIAATATGRGYWLAARDGRVFTFGDAQPHGGGFHGRFPVVGIAIRPRGLGYWLVDQQGHAFSFGDAPHLGSADDRITQPVVGIVATPSGHGYWLAGHGSPVGGPREGVSFIATRTISAPNVIEVRWNAVAGATGYRVMRGFNVGGPFGFVAGVDVVTGTTTLEPGVLRVSGNGSSLARSTTFSYVEELTAANPRWYYRVTAYNAAGDAPASATVAACSDLVNYGDC